MSKLIIKRDRAYIACLRAFKIVVDGREIAMIKNGQNVSLDLTAGEHEVFLKMDWSRSKKLRFAMAEGEERFFTCGPSLLGLKLLPSDPFKVDPIPMPSSGLDMTLEFNWQTLVVVLLLLAALGLVGVRTYAFMQLNQIKTVDHLAFDGEQVCIHHDHTLYLLTPGGWLRDSITLAELGISDTPADLEFARDGKLLIGDGGSKSIYSCDLATRQCEQVKFSNWVAISDNYKFTYDKGRDVLYIADTNGHTLVAKPMVGEDSMSMPGVKLSYPNDLVLAANGDLLIADTKNSRITALELDDSARGYSGQHDLMTLAKLPEPSTSFAGMEGLTEKVAVGAVSNYPSPLALAGSHDGNWWVVVTDAYINYGEIWKFSRDGKLINKISLSERAIPLDIIQVGKRLLVSDSEDNLIYSIDSVSGRSDVFGDEHLQQILAEARDKREIYRQIKSNSFKYIAVLLVGLIIMLMIHKRSQAAKQLAEKGSSSGQAAKS